MLNSITCAGLIELLVKNGKQIEAVRFIHAFQLTESFPLVPLLKTYLKELRRNSQGKSEKNMGGGACGPVSSFFFLSFFRLFIFII